MPSQRKMKNYFRMDTVLKIIILLTSFMIASCENIGQVASLQASISQTLHRAALVVNVTDTIVYDPAISFFSLEGQQRTYFSEDQLFYDATALNGWNFVIDYSVEKTGDNFLMISTSLPANRTSSDLLTFRQSLLFTGKSSGNTTIEFYDKEKIVFMHKGTFTLNSKEFLINNSSLKHRTFDLTPLKIDAKYNLLSISRKSNISVHFIDESKISFSVDGAEYTGKNNQFIQDSVSEVKMKGILDIDNTPYTINFNYYDFTTGIFELDLGQSTTKLSGNFESHRYTAISSVPLKGEIIRGHSLRSQYTGITYPYDIYLPPGYKTSKRAYPVVYVTDGQWESDLANIVDLHKKNVLIVFISQGPDDRRMVDYQPSGADAYIQFLKQELVPLIEANYRANDTRSYFGTSLGGLLGGILISQETADKPFFKNYILSDGSFWGITPEIIAAETANHKKNRRLPINIFLSGTLRGNALYVANYEKRFRDRRYKDLKIINKTLPYLHDEMTGPTLSSFINFID